MLSTLYPINSIFFYRLVFMGWLIFGEALFLYKYKKKKHFLIRLPIVILLCLLFAFIFPIPLADPIYQMIMFFMFFGFTYGATFFLFEADWRILFFSTICGYTCEHIAYETYFSLINFFNFNPYGAGGMYDYDTISLFSGWQEEIIYFFSYIIIYYFAFMFFARRISKEFTYDPKDRSGIKVLIIGAFFLMIDIVINSYISYYEGVHRDNIYLGVIGLINVFACLLGLFYIYEMFYSNSIKNSLRLQEALKNEEINQYKVSKETIDMINIKCHDFRHQIRKLGKEQNIDEEAISQVNSLIRIYDSSYRTENEALNVILTEKSLQCLKKEIQLSTVVDGDALSFISPEDIYALFGNIIDNAIEAVENLELEQRVISLKIRKVGNMISISSKNAYVGIIEKQLDMPISKKKDSLNHGFGLKSIRMICEKYNGTFSYKDENNLFIVNILFVK